MKFASTALAALAASLSFAAIPAHAEDYPQTAEGAAKFVADAEKDLFDFSLGNNQANWVNYTYITEDTDALAAQSNGQLTEKQVKYAVEAAKFAKVAGLDADVSRKLGILRQGIVLPAPNTPGAAAQLSEITTRLSSAYGKGKGTLDVGAVDRFAVERALAL
ncbi:MAG: M2 family metallopeptidase, partial [Novosphingobium sp.]